MTMFVTCYDIVGCGLTVALQLPGCGLAVHSGKKANMIMPHFSADNYLPQGTIIVSIQYPNIGYHSMPLNSEIYTL